MKHVVAVAVVVAAAAVVAVENYSPPTPPKVHCLSARNKINISLKCNKTGDEKLTLYYIIVLRQGLTVTVIIWSLSQR